MDQAVDRLAVEMDVPRADVVRKAVKLYVVRQDHISELLSEAREREAAYQAIGRGVPWEEISAWLRSGAPKDERPVARKVHG